MSTNAKVHFPSLTSPLAAINEQYDGDRNKENSPKDTVGRAGKRFRALKIQDKSPHFSFTSLGLSFSFFFRKGTLLA